MRSQHKGFRVFRVEMPLHEFGPQKAGSPQFGDFHEIMHAGGKEKGQARRKGINIKPCCHAGANVFKPVSKSIGKLEIIRGASLLHVIAGDGNKIELRHVGRAIAKNI